ncbi:uncharacterized protein LOC105286243 isoform X3 [Ooceraea biroi]|uniref:uncharacterized protein LOC105286243 isoform X3 n=1 Tax=Ooceraea biroi TaxID=2015173 RepID=UPI000F086FC0|nr:uncharacterized protein LOC105286243 isoform X3 [Ooceraea biroi]
MYIIVTLCLLGTDKSGDSGSLRSEEMVQKKTTISRAQEEHKKSHGSREEDMEVADTELDGNVMLEMSQALVSEIRGHNGAELLANDNMATNSDRIRDRSTTDCYVVIDGTLRNVLDVDAQTLDRLYGLFSIYRYSADKQKEDKRMLSARV